MSCTLRITQHAYEAAAPSDALHLLAGRKAQEALALGEVEAHCQVVSVWRLCATDEAALAGKPMQRRTKNIEEVASGSWQFHFTEHFDSMGTAADWHLCSRFFQTEHASSWAELPLLRYLLLHVCFTPELPRFSTVTTVILCSRGCYAVHQWDGHCASPLTPADLPTQHPASTDVMHVQLVTSQTQRPAARDSACAAPDTPTGPEPSRRRCQQDRAH